MGLFDPDELNRLVVTLGHLAAVAAGVLVVTGIPLVFAYDPDGGWLSTAHSLASALLIGSAAGVVACVAGTRLRRSRHWVGWPLAAAGLGVAAAGALTGQVLRWTDLRPADDDARGLFGPLGDGVDAVVVGDGELAPGSFLVLGLVHVVVVSAAAAAVGVWFRRRQRHAADGSPTDEAVEPSEAE